MRTLLTISLAILLAGGATLADEPPTANTNASDALRVMTFNIRFNNPGDGENAWPHRRDWVAEIIRAQRVDVLGVQEAMPDQIADLESRLTDYGWYGVGRNDGQRGGEHTPIFYRKSRLTLLDQGAFWLSEEPDKPGSKGWDTAITRVTVWAKLRDQVTDTTFFAFNTHFDHVGRQAREESARLLLRKIPEIAGNAPVVLTGDFNCTPNAAPYQILTSNGEKPDAFRLSDAIAVSQTEPRGPTGTWNGFRRIAAGQRIDYIFVTPHATVLSHVTLDDSRDGRFPSDHLPVLAEIRLGR